MNKIYALFILCLGWNVDAQIITFSDANFKAKLLQADVTNGIAMNDFGDNIKIDLNNNSEIELSEALNVYRIDVNNSGITTLSGLENFANLNIIDCSYNQLTSLDLTFRPYMIAINGSHNSITEVNFPPVIDEGVVITHNLIETLELSSDGLTFFQLDVRNNPNLTSIFIKDAEIETIYSADYFNASYLSNCPNLQYICAKNSDWPHIQTALTTNGNSDCILNDLCDGGDLVIDFPDSNLKTKLLQADVTNEIAQFNKIDTNNNGEIEWSEIQGIEFLNISNSSIADLSGIEYFRMMGFNCSNNSITSMDQLNQKSLEFLDCSHNQLNELVIETTTLVDLYCSYNSLEILDLSMLNATDTVNLRNNNLSSFIPPDYISYLDIRNNNFNGFSVPTFVWGSTLVFGGNPSDQLMYTDGWRTPVNLIYSGGNAAVLDLSNVPVAVYELFSQQPSFNFIDCPLLENVKLNNGLLSTYDYGGSLNISNCPSLNLICADAGEEDYFMLRLNGLGLIDQVQVSTQCQLTHPVFELENIVLFPNPAENILNIEVSDRELVSISVYNVVGQSVLEIQNAKQITSIDVSQLNSGTYFIKIGSDKGTFHSKFIKD